jgi:hypothetical protein
MAKNIDLGMKMSEPLAVPESPKTDKMSYPSLYIDSDKALPDIPDEGTMTVEYKVRGRSKNQSSDGSERHSLTLDVTKILDCCGDDGEESINDEDQDREAQLDKLAEEESAKKESEQD